MNIIELLPPIGQIVRRCPTQTLIDAYSRASRDFCGQSRWYRENFTVTTTPNDAGPYELIPGSGLPLEVIGVRQIIATAPIGTPLSTWRVTPLDITLWNPLLLPAPPKWYAYLPEGAIQFYQTPDQAYSMAVTAALQPTLGATEIPDVLLLKWERVLQAGALANLLAIPGQGWSNPVEAARYQKVFQAGISNAKADEARGYNQGSMRARPRAFALGR